ncbi:Pex2 / Pex12 amino terminal region [Teratosphaeria destructans]|uniref:Pex2 / Pex12 amino terminal region n=1 Tax=Teratosphaeria destructans TaxID=418781 RepID=A0A9W7SXD9_9PEZI|nr:Pex2 / Pex12 amino terminal region [Teratosphaeria destructans]
MANFAAATERVLQRRAARAAAENGQRARRQEELQSKTLALPPALRELTHQFLAISDAIRSPFGTRPSFRVGQVDAELLDEELLSLLTNQAGDGLKLFGNHLKDEYGAEIGLLLRSLLWKLSIWDNGASYGATLQGLQYVDARNPNTAARTPPKAWQRLVYGLLTVGGRYAWTRWEQHLSDAENGYDEPSPLIRRLSRLTSLLGTTHDIAAFISFLVFLYNGRYRTLTDRLLRLRLVPSSNQTSREVSFEYLNRQLVWHAFTEFLLFLLPLVGISRWRRWIARAWKKAKATIMRLRTGDAAAAEDAQDIQKGELGFLPERTCAICYQDQNPAGGQSEQQVISAGANAGIIGNASTDITNPYETISCACIYCYVCLAQRIEAEEGEGWICLRCGELVKECKPWEGDVIPPTPSLHTNGHTGRPSSSGRKSIAWADELVDGEEQQDTMPERRMSQVDPVPVVDEEYVYPVDDRAAEAEHEQAYYQHHEGNET